MIQFRLMLGDVGDDSRKRVFCLLYFIGKTDIIFCSCLVFFVFSAFASDYGIVLFFVLFCHNHRVTLSDPHIL